MQLIRLSHIAAIAPSIIALSIILTAPASAKKTPTKSAAIVTLIAPNADRADPVRDAMFRVAFGKAAPADRTIEDEKYSFYPETVYPLGGDMFALISMADNYEAGHAQSGRNAIHYLRKTASGYQVVGEWLNIGVSGTFGEPAYKYGLTTKLGKNPYLITQAGGTWQGYTCDATYLTELTPSMPIERAGFDSGYSNGGAAVTKQKLKNIDGVITAAVPDVSFTVNFTGTHKFTQKWQLKEKEYILNGKNKVPEC